MGMLAGRRGVDFFPGNQVSINMCVCARCWRCCCGRVWKEGDKEGKCVDGMKSISVSLCRLFSIMISIIIRL